MKFRIHAYKCKIQPSSAKLANSVFKISNATFVNFKMTFNTTFAKTHFLKLCYNVFILKNKIDARVFRRTCVNLCYILLEIALICVNLERVYF
jgi:hypothetical protein